MDGWPWRTIRLSGALWLHEVVAGELPERARVLWVLALKDGCPGAWLEPARLPFLPPCLPFLPHEQPAARRCVQSSSMSQICPH